MTAIPAQTRRIAAIFALIALGLLLSDAVGRFGLLDRYYLLILGYIGINVILATSLNLVNGYMGEFSIGHAGFMAAGAYVSAFLTVRVFPVHLQSLLFPLAVAAGGAAAALLGLLVAIPSFRTRGDYLAIVTLAFTMIVKSAIENIPALGGPRGFLGMHPLTTLPWIYLWCAAAVFFIRNFIYSSFGRGMLAIREDETAGELMGVDVRRVKAMAFSLSSFFAGVGGALLAHLLLFINPRMFDINRSTDVLIMVYLGGIGSLAGSAAGAVIYTVLLEVLRPVGVWRMVLMPLILVLIMIYRPRGIMGLKEIALLLPSRDRSRRDVPIPESERGIR